ncbi:Delta(6)-protoilludene synthase 18 [Psilocybe cubensis]|uniref:Sesquiterpene synthase cubC n=2 Tax=Psilocybe cubensis TaxID=181762 RepID=CUBC_PSICU|nr:Delta(6)-protoilludene synthase 18 [Psilocybe cubensis]KAH9477939.1 Delta(6)-protoilludene synthase 18 [Psilocybe cubensis]
MSTVNITSTTNSQHSVAEDLQKSRTAHPPTYILPDPLRNWPYERAINPYFERAKAESAAWTKSFGQFSPAAQAAFDDGVFSLSAALGYPTASPYILRSACDIMQAYFILDDNTDAVNAEVARLHCNAVMEAVVNPDVPRPEGEPIIGEITRQCWKRASVGAPNAAKERFVKTWLAYVETIYLQANRRDKSYICTIDEYIATRRDNIGTYPTFFFIEMSLGVDIPHHIMDHPTIVRLNRDTIDLTILGNDMYSYKKEVLAGDASYNAVTIVMHNLRLSLDEAIQWISDLQDDLVINFLKLREDVVNKRNFPTYGAEMDRQIVSYIDGLGQWMRGVTDWHFECGRYFGDEGLEIQRTRKVVIA